MATINLPHNFTPRGYQAPGWNMVMNPEFKRGMLVWPRRCGKDLTCWNLVVAKAWQRVGVYYYMAPYYTQARQIIWEGATGAGVRFLDSIPAALIRRKTKVDMRITLVNGSQIKLLGSDRIDAIVGTNPIGIVFTEFSLHKRGAWNYLRPVLAENGGWALFNGTPRGTANEFYEIYEMASSPKSSWALNHLSRDDTNVPTLAAIEEDRQSGMPEALILQEYYTNFLSGSLGTYYATEMNMLQSEGRFTYVPWNPSYPVYTFWDLGKADACAIWFIQAYNDRIFVIDYYEEVEVALTEHVKAVLQRQYVYGEHFAPHDIKVEEMSTKKSRWDYAAEVGIEFVVVPKLPLQDGIEAVRQVLPRCYFDRDRTGLGRKALKHYHKAYNERTETYSEGPAKSKFNHGADGFRYFAVMVDTIVDFHSFKNAPPQVIRAIGNNVVPLDIRRHRQPVSGIHSFMNRRVGRRQLSASGHMEGR